MTLRSVAVHAATLEILRRRHEICFPTSETDVHQVHFAVVNPRDLIRTPIVTNILHDLRSLGEQKLLPISFPVHDLRVEFPQPRGIGLSGARHVVRRVVRVVSLWDFDESLLR